MNEMTIRLERNGAAAVPGGQLLLGYAGNRGNYRLRIEQLGEHYWGIVLDGGNYTVYEAGTVPPPPTAEELAAQNEAAKKQAEREALPDTVKALRAALADADALNLDQDYRLTLLELGVTDDETTA